MCLDHEFYYNFVDDDDEDFIAPNTSVHRFALDTLSDDEYDFFATAYARQALRRPLRTALRNYVALHRRVLAQNGTQAEESRFVVFVDWYGKRLVRNITLINVRCLGQKQDLAIDYKRCCRRCCLH